MPKKKIAHNRIKFDRQIRYRNRKWMQGLMNRYADVYRRGTYRRHPLRGCQAVAERIGIKPQRLKYWAKRGRAPTWLTDDLYEIAKEIGYGQGRPNLDAPVTRGRADDNPNELMEKHYKEIEYLENR